MEIFSPTFARLEQGLDYASLKQKVIANNIANADTPNYKAKEVRFKTELDQAMSSFEAYRTNPKHFAFASKNTGNFLVTTRSDMVYNHNGNSVDVDREMSELAENQIYYNALIERLNGKFNSLKTVIKGGK
ncbi:flagellar basal body rod protein FlgB [Anoxybacillus rupiensis]|uniref:Flagellar basal body rod protein FlgB n=1 Tax=Anoxybacteroides rupiense TaxID=311460 RepID=A0ABD5IQD0_9BACL|nr:MULTISPECIES: flagellar basal body rod protein FlgB [Anoxybacillus]KXG10543.1 Flagellar basal body rod protein FlgB [Anoxybacillus sp. P3H1B]MBB3906173.1 flagellar basal-body rod protein FlgB [Anoxybacillus rupiensis]MBS2771002.1 flagellar basal body rod protein FlgB [Anoxybacillus rupiensis]MDE8563112.1 flagellar basal body rod protein FlgB [Anoxybacillus rupiensis]MED5050472.1 flagellar basal body rod protein FlgB [Anoxybacillus rupiensis]